MQDILSNPAFTGAIASLGIGTVFLALFATGRLPTPAVERNLRDQIVSERQAHETELTAVRTNLRRDLDEVHKVNAEKDEYIRKLVDGIFEQQQSVQKDVVPTLSVLAQQVPVIIFTLQEIQRKREANGK